MFCKAYKKAVLLTSTEENVRIWTGCTCVQESYELAQMLHSIGALLKNEILPKEQQTNGQ